MMMMTRQNYHESVKVTHSIQRERMQCTHRIVFANKLRTVAIHKLQSDMNQRLTVVID